MISDEVSNAIQQAKRERVTSNEIKRALADKHYKDFFLTEVKSGSTWMTAKGDMKILDGLAVRKSWTSPCFTGYEIKVSRGDFLRDAKFYTYEELCNCLYIVCPKGMIDRTELPESVGLMYYDAAKRTLQTKKKAIYRKIEYSPDLLMYIIYSRLDSDRYPFFSSKEEYFREYVAHKRDSKLLGYSVGTRLVQENAELVKKLERIDTFRKNMDEYNAIIDVLHAHDIYGYGWKEGHYAKALDAALKKTCPIEISDVRRLLEKALDKIDQMEEVTANE